jgi:hypothetical protein
VKKRLKGRGAMAPTSSGSPGVLKSGAFLIEPARMEGRYFGSLAL